MADWDRFWQHLATNIEGVDAPGEIKMKDELSMQ